MDFPTSLRPALALEQHVQEVNFSNSSSFQRRPESAIPTLRYKAHCVLNGCQSSK